MRFGLTWGPECMESITIDTRQIEIRFHGFCLRMPCSQKEMAYYLSLVLPGVTLESSGAEGLR